MGNWASAVEKMWPEVHSVILGRLELGWAKEEELPRKTSPAQYRENLTPSDLWPQLKPSPTSGKSPFSKVDLSLMSHGISWPQGRGVEGCWRTEKKSRKYIRVLAVYPSSPTSSPSPRLPAGSQLRQSVGKGSAMILCTAEAHLQESDSREEKESWACLLPLTLTTG